MIKCLGCSEILRDDILSGELCPNCGCRQRNIYVCLKEEIKLSNHISMTGVRDGKTIGFRESEREGRAASADVNDNGTLSHSLSGSSPQGEEDTLNAGRILVESLNHRGGNWQSPVPGHGNEDCVATDKIDNSKKIAIQLVRAITDPKFWRELSQKGHYNETQLSKEELVNQIRTAVEKKANDSKIPFPMRRSLILALDATRLPALCFNDVVEAYRTLYTAETKILGFESVWLVGPIPDLVWRLD